jgi:DNA-binding response OmpR family regulator
MRIRVVEDDPHIAEFVQEGLREASYAVDTPPTGRRRWRSARMSETIGAAEAWLSSHKPKAPSEAAASGAR